MFRNKQEYLISLSDTPVFCGRIFVMDENEYSIMLRADEY